MKMYLPYNTFYSGPSNSAANNSNNFVDRRKLFAVLNFQVIAFYGHGIVI